MGGESRSKKVIRVLFIASEAAPLVKAGGLGDVAGALPAALNRLGAVVGGASAEVRLVIPFYNSIKTSNISATFIRKFKVSTLNGAVEAGLFETSLSGVVTYLVSGAPVSESASIYGKDFKEDAEKFVFFSLACLKIPSLIGWKCDILHANDWHTAVAIHHLATAKKKNASLQTTRSVLTIHNLPFMGSGVDEALVKYKISPSNDDNLPNWGKTQPLPMGLAAADRIVAVSPTYAKEILTPEYGCDLQDFLRKRSGHLTGILNGIDVESWDPATDPALKFNFAVSNFTTRSQNKRALLAEFGFPVESDVPLLALVSRFDWQKGIDIIIAGLRAMKNFAWRVILLGTGERNLEQACRDLEDEMPGKVRAAILFDVQLSRRIYAGADLLLMPSRYEPCGLSQMYAMRYGCLPIARATGGLADTVSDPLSSTVPTGFLFPNADASSFITALKRALRLYKKRAFWQAMQFNAMSRDFSWSVSARNYLDLYTQLSENSSIVSEP